MATDRKLARKAAIQRRRRLAKVECEAERDICKALFEEIGTIEEYKAWRAAEHKLIECLQTNTIAG